MIQRRFTGHLMRTAAWVCGALHLAGCASGSSMLVAGSDGGVSGFEAQEDPGATEEATSSAPDMETAPSPILAASGNSLLPLPASFAAQPAAGPLAPGGVSVQPKIGLAAGVGTPLANVALGAGLGGVPNVAVAAQVGLPGATPLAAVSLSAPTPSVFVSVVGTSLASVSGGSATVLGINPTTTVSNVVGTVAPSVSNVVGTVAPTLTNAAAVLGGTANPTATPTLPLNPLTTPVSTVVNQLLTRPSL